MSEELLLMCANCRCLLRDGVVQEHKLDGQVPSAWSHGLCIECAKTLYGEEIAFYPVKSRPEDFGTRGVAYVAGKRVFPAFSRKPPKQFNDPKTEEISERY